MDQAVALFTLKLFSSFRGDAYSVSIFATYACHKNPSAVLAVHKTRDSPT